MYQFFAIIRPTHASMLIPVFDEEEKYALF